MRAFIAGATGAIGLPLARALCTLGQHGDRWWWPAAGLVAAAWPGYRSSAELGAEVSVADAFRSSKAVLNAIEQPQRMW